MPYAGFPAAGLRFLGELERHNERPWFQAHRDEYEANVLEPARELVDALGAELARFAPGVQADPRVGGSIMRIARDTRFSKDKRPYKTHLDLWFWEGPPGSSKESPGYWFRLTPKTLTLGAGRHSFERPVLERYREAVADDERGTALVRLAKQLRKKGYELGGRRYKRVPAGYDVDPARAELLLHDSLYGGLELPLPPEVSTGRFAAFCARRYRPLAPLNRWLLSLG